MSVLDRVRVLFTDGRFDANLIAVYGLIVAVVLTSLLLRRLLVRSGGRVLACTGQHWLNAVGEEATRRARQLLFWSTLGAIGVVALAGLAYHLAGRDVRADLRTLYARMTAEDLVDLCLSVAGMVLVVGGAWLLTRVVRRGLGKLEARVLIGWGAQAANRNSRQWFFLLELYAAVSVRLAALYLVCILAGLGDLGGAAVGFVWKFISILAAARLLTLAGNVFSRALATFGDQHLKTRQFSQYWERIKRLFPFGERCFEAVVYVTTASLVVEVLHLLSERVYEFGPRVVACIGIFFSTRVLIELSQVLLYQAFGLYEEQAGRLDQKSRTLVPLLQSVCQYVFYFGSIIFMMEVLKIPTTPFLAGAGILGLAVGLGAQNLVTDLVSGFFILFENQYLVGDYVQIGDASGVVEAVGIRLTQVRDSHGRLFILPNGQVKTVVNYSKGYVNAVVDVKVSSGLDLEKVFRAMAEAGRRLRQERSEVLADTEVHGLVDWGTSEMTVRAVTKVEPGNHLSIQNEYRRHLKLLFDQSQARPAVAA